MTQEIIEMARDSGMELYGLGKDRARFVHHLEAFAKLVAEKALKDHAMREVQRLGQEIEQEPVAHPERHELQAKGEHPAPCARHCEANAFQIVIKNLKAQLAQPEQEPVVGKWSLREVYFDEDGEPLMHRSPPEQNFCSRCGKRTPDLITIHTCTPPKENA
jgi:hypothetical protein